MVDSSVLLHLSLIEGIGPAAIQTIIDNKKELSDVYQMAPSDFVEQFGFTFEKSEKIVVGLRDKVLFEQECSLLGKHHINWITIEDEAYPELLKHIHLPPPVLYWQGEPLFDDQQSMAIVGSRAMNWYGKMAIEKLVPPLVEHDWTIVSGGAIGADSYAHHMTLKAGGRTVAVLGSGLLSPYPLSNKRLFNEIVASGGTLVSPFPLTFGALPGNFPARNRIIAGLSKGCVVVQAAIKSGARITANFALNQGRDVFAVPGPIHDELSAGCHALIKEGAILVNSGQDILNEYTPVQIVTHRKKPSQASLKNTTHRNESIPNTVQDPIKEQILLNCTNPTALDELSQITGLSQCTLTEQLFDLQLEGRICQQMGLWKRC